jgi:CHAT domain-containing protein
MHLGCGFDVHPPGTEMTELVEAEEILGDAFFPYRLDVDPGPAADAVRALRAEGRHAPADYLEARVAALAGDFGRAARIAGAIAPGLDPQRRERLRVLEPWWRVMRFADAEGRLSYSEDVQIVLPEGPQLLPVEIHSEEGARLRARTEALYTLSLVSAVLDMSSTRHPMADELGQQVLEGLAGAFFPDGGPSPEMAHLVVPLMARVVGSTEAADAGRDLARRFAEEGQEHLAACAWMRAGDVALDERSGPFELGFLSLDTVSATVARNAGRTVREFRPPAPEAEARARECYASARAALTGRPARRIEAHLAFREAVLGWRSGTGGSDPGRLQEIASALRAAGDVQAAFGAGVVHAVVAELAGAPHSLRREATGVTLGLSLGAIRLLGKASVYALHERGDVTAAYRLRDLAIDLARDVGATQMLSHQLADQARHLISLGQSRNGSLLLQEAVGLQEHYLKAIPGIAVLTDRAAAENGVRQVQYEQLNQLVHAALGLGELDRARGFNERLREIEARGIVFGLPGQSEEERVLKPQSGANRVLIEIHAGNYDLALQLARGREDPLQEALVLLVSGRDSEAAERAEGLVEAGMTVLEELADRDEADLSLVYQQRRSEVERGLEMLLQAGRYEVARRLFEDGEARLGEGRLFGESGRPWGRPHFRARLAAGLGDPAATSLFEESVDRMRGWAEQVGGTHSAVRFDSEVAPLVNDWIEHLLRGGEPGRGLQELERFRARDFQAALMASAQLAGESRELLSSWQRAEAAFQVELRSADRGEGDPARLDDLEEAVRESRRRLLAELGADPDPGIDPTEVQSRVDAARVTLLVYHLRGERSSVTVLRPGTGPEVVALSLERHELARRVRGLTTAMRTVDPAWRPQARALYRDLVEPAEDLLPVPGEKPPPLLGIIPFGGSHAVPFEVLVAAGRPLVTRFDLFHLPSLLGFLRGGPRATRRADTPVRAIGFDGELLSHAEAEARMVDPGARVGSGATRAGLMELLDGAAPVHAAVHAEPGADNPFFTLLRLADGDVHLHEIRGRPMDSPLVLLSACETAASERLPSDQITGFATTFLENGVDGVVVTRWAIDDELTVPLIRDFYAALGEGASPARALGRAQRAAFEGGGRRAHPSFWGAFQFIGPP